MVTIPLPHTYFSNSKVCKAQQFPLDKLCVTIVKRPCTLRSIIYNDYIHVGRIYCMPVLLIFFSSLGVFKNSSCNFLRDFSCVPPFFKFVFCFLYCHFINHKIPRYHFIIWLFGANFWQLYAAFMYFDPAFHTSLKPLQTQIHVPLILFSHKGISVK